MRYSSEMLDSLRQEVKCRVSEKRFLHIQGVERCAKKLGELILPEYVSELRAAALLHDVTKEVPIDDQLNMLEDSDFPLTDEDKATVGILHSFTAPIVIKREFSEFSTDNILSAVLNHTVGRENMSIFDKIIFISDYAEDTRTYPSCINVRKMLFDGLEDKSETERLVQLDEACIASINGALDALQRGGHPINSRMYLTKNYLLKNKFQR